MSPKSDDNAEFDILYYFHLSFFYIILIYLGVLNIFMLIDSA